MSNAQTIDMQPASAPSRGIQSPLVARLFGMNTDQELQQIVAEAAAVQAQGRLVDVAIKHTPGGETVLRNARLEIDPHDRPFRLDDRSVAATPHSAHVLRRSAEQLSSGLYAEAVIVAGIAALTYAYRPNYGDLFGGLSSPSLIARVTDTATSACIEAVGPDIARTLYAGQSVDQAAAQQQIKACVAQNLPPRIEVANGFEYAGIGLSMVPTLAAAFAVAKLIARRVQKAHLRPTYDAAAQIIAGNDDVHERAEAASLARALAMPA